MPDLLVNNRAGLATLDQVSRAFWLDETRSLYLSSIIPVSDRHELAARGIVRVVTVCDAHIHRYSGITYHKVDIRDDEHEDIIVHLDGCIAFMNDGLKEGSVLVHCQASQTQGKFTNVMQHTSIF